MEKSEYFMNPKVGEKQIYTTMKEFLKTIQNKTNNQEIAMSVRDVLGNLKKYKKPTVVGGGFRKLPAVSAFKIFLNQVNPLLQAVGIERRLPNTIRSAAHPNRKMNRYADYMMRRLGKMRKDPKKY